MITGVLGQGPEVEIGVRMVKEKHAQGGRGCVDSSKRNKQLSGVEGGKSRVLSLLSGQPTPVDFQGKRTFQIGVTEHSPEVQLQTRLDWVA